MPDDKDWFARLAAGLPERRLFRSVAERILVSFWARWTGVKPQPGGPPYAVAPGDNLQNMMNLVMPLKDKSAIGRAKAAKAIAENVDEIFAGLNNVGTVHFARFVLVDGNLCMFSVYDGDFTNYIRDFIGTIGSVFDAVVALVEGGDAVIPSEDNIEAFIDWVHAHDMYQVPDLPTDLLVEQGPDGAAATGQDSDNLRLLRRKMILQLHANPNASLGSGYRAYPGYSVAQVRRKLGVGW